MLRRPNGGYLVSGFRRNGSNTTFELRGLTAGGAFEPSYAQGGFGYGRVARPDGTFIVIPSFWTNVELEIDVSANDRIRRLMQDPDGKLIAVGYVDVGVDERPRIARIE